MAKKSVQKAKGAPKKKQGRATAPRTPKARNKPGTSGKGQNSGKEPSSEPVVANNTTWMTSDQLEHFRALLLEKLAEITGDVDDIELGALKASRADATGDLSSMPIHMADIGSDNYEQEFALGLMDSERQMVHEIIAALKRIDDGTYGVCEGTGDPIPLTRLNGIPWARYCLKYAAMAEKGRGGQARQSEAALSTEDLQTEDHDQQNADDSPSDRSAEVEQSNEDDLEDERLEE